MEAKKTAIRSINKIAETQYFLRPIMVKSLKQFILSEDMQKSHQGTKNYFDFWTKSFGDKFFDMGTLIRLATEIELGLQYYYMEKRNISRSVDLKRDDYFENNIFQRLLPGGKSNSALIIYKEVLKYDLFNNSQLKHIQELVLCRHLYAHKSGLLYDHFMKEYLELTGVDLRKTNHIGHYPDEEVYFFEPLDRLKTFIEAARKFFEEFPE